jgi:hypothetical protein
MRLLFLFQGFVVTTNFSLNGEPQGVKVISSFYTNSGDYTVTVTDANGCSATATRYLSSLRFPNVFTQMGTVIAIAGAY